MSHAIATFNDFMSVAVFFYNTIGVDPNPPIGASQRSRFLLYLYFVLCVVNVSFVLGLEIVFVLQTLKHDFVSAAKTLSYVGFVMVGELKMLTVWWQLAKLTRLMRQMEAIFPSQQPMEQRQYRVQYYLRHCRLVIRGFGGLMLLLITTYSSIAILNYVVKRWWMHMPDAEQTMPFVSTSPWNWHDNWTFYLMYAIQAHAGYIATTGHTSCDLLIYAIVLQVIMHFDNLARSFEEYQMQPMRTPGGFERDLQKLQQMIIYHNKLIELTAVVNNVFGIPLLLNFFTSSMVVCLMGFLISVGVPFEMMLYNLLFLSSCMVEIYLICHFSQLLIDASSSVSMAVYNMDWSQADLRCRRMLILIALRAQKPVFLKATIFINVSRATMTGFMQMSYKFFALVRTVYRQ